MSIAYNDDKCYKEREPGAPRSSTTGNFTCCVYEGRGTRGSLGKGITREERFPKLS